MKEDLLKEFESTLFDFWGEKPTKRKIQEAWRDYLDAIKADEPVEKEWYKLTKEEKEHLYKVAEL